MAQQPPARRRRRLQTQQFGATRRKGLSERVGLGACRFARWCVERLVWGGGVWWIARERPIPLCPVLVCEVERTSWPESTHKVTQTQRPPTQPPWFSALREDANFVRSISWVLKCLPCRLLACMRPPWGSVGESSTWFSITLSFILCVTFWLITLQCPKVCHHASRRGPHYSLFNSANKMVLQLHGMRIIWEYSPGQSHWFFKYVTQNICRKKRATCVEPQLVCDSIQTQNGPATIGVATLDASCTRLPVVSGSQV